MSYPQNVYPIQPQPTYIPHQDQPHPTYIPPQGQPQVAVVYQPVGVPPLGSSPQHMSKFALKDKREKELLRISF